MPRLASLGLLIVAALLVPVLAATPAGAGAGIWTSLGPDGGSVRSLAVDPSDPGVVYAGTLDAGLYKSTDGGDTWALTGRGLPVGDVVAIVFDPRRSSTLYTMLYGTGVYRSTDAGKTWKVTSPQGQPFLETVGLMLTIDPRRPRVLYAGTRQGVYRSANGGATWKPRSKGLPPGSWVRTLVVDDRTGAIYAGVQANGLFRSDDQAVTWQPVGTGLPAGISVAALALDPSGAGTMLAGTDKGIYRSTNRGRSWSFAGGPEALVLSLAFQRRGKAYAGYSNRGIARSDDGGATWQPALEELPRRAAVLGIAASPQAVYAGTTNGRETNGVFRSFDAGATWEPAQRNLTALSVRAVAVDPADRHTLYAGVETGGLVKSGDGGASWTPLDVPTGLGVIGQILIEPARPATIYAPFNLDGPLLRSDDGGGSWRRVGQLPQRQGFTSKTSLAADPRTPGALWAASSMGLFQSTDAGVTWRPIDLGSEAIVLNAVEVSPSDPNVLFAAGMATFDRPLPEARLFRSADGGRTWQRRDAGLSERELEGIALDPADPARLWAFNRVDIYRSTDGGDTWRLVRSELPSIDGVYTNLAAAPGALYVTRQGIGHDDSIVLRSTDGGDTWTPLSPGLGFHRPSVLEIDPHDPARLLLGTWEGSLLTWTEP